MMPTINSTPIIIKITQIGNFYRQRLTSSMELADNKQVVGPEQVIHPVEQGKQSGERG